MTEQGRAGQSRAEQGRAGQGRAEQGRAEQGRAGHRAGQGRAEQRRAAQSSAYLHVRHGLAQVVKLERLLRARVVVAAVALSAKGRNQDLRVRLLQLGGRELVLVVLGKGPARVSGRGKCTARAVLAPARPRALKPPAPPKRTRRHPPSAAHRSTAARGRLGAGGNGTVSVESGASRPHGALGEGAGGRPERADAKK